METQVHKPRLQKNQLFYSYRLMNTVSGNDNRSYRIEHPIASANTTRLYICYYRQASPLDILHFWRFLCKQVCKQQVCCVISCYNYGGCDFIASDSLSDATLFYWPAAVGVDYLVNFLARATINIAISAAPKKASIPESHRIFGVGCRSP